MGTPNKDVVIKEDAPTELLLKKHLDFLVSYAERKNDYEYVVTEYLRMSGIYWTTTALALGGADDRLDEAEIVSFVASCQHDSGGFGASVHHDAHLLYTLSAVQILVTYEALDRVDVEKLVRFIAGLQQNDGSFFGDAYGEVDTRFSFCATAALRLLDRLDAIDVAKATEFVLACKNFDGGFGVRPGSETHAGQVYCCLGFLAITDNLHHVDPDQLGWWLCERQLPSGGLNGRPEKLPDVCYSWWVLSSLAILGRLHWIDGKKLAGYILACQDAEDGGFADRPGDCVDPFHTLFGLAGLSLLGHDDDQLARVNPVFCMPQTVISRLHLSPILLKL